MPRLKVSAKDYIEPKLSELIGGILFNRKISQETIAKELGVSQPSVSRRIHSGDLSVKELLIILKVADADQDDWERIQKIYR